MRLAALASASALLVGCSGDSSTGPPSPPQNQAPQAEITSPSEGATFTVGEPIAFAGSGTDPEDGILSAAALVWTSSVAGQIGTGNVFARDDLSVGLHTIILTASDAAGLTGEASISITISPGALPDLRPGIISVLPSTPSASEPVTFEASISNLGTAATAAPIAWRMSVDGGEIAVGEVPSLAAGLTSEPIVVADQGPFAAGLHDVVLEIDPEDEIAELDETNNERSLTVNFVAGPTPDLAVTSISVTPAGATDSEPVTIAAEITNVGEAATGTGFAWSLLMDDVEVARGAAPALDPGASFTGISETVGPLVSQAYLVEVRADADGAIEEPDEEDNVGAVGFSVLGPDFDIELRFQLPASVAQTRAFTEAANRWTGLITGDVEDSPLDTSEEDCHPPVNEIVDDLIIFVELIRIDGPGGILGQAGPCFLRDDTMLPLSGIMRFDNKDLESLESLGLLEDVILHEMAHVLGFGTVWTSLGLLSGAGTPNVLFIGEQAGLAFEAIGGSGFGGAVPVENTGGPGTRDGHWRESVFGNELMTGFVDQSNSLSIVSVAQFADVGYEVDDTQADDFALRVSVRRDVRARTDGGGGLVDLSRDVREGPIYTVDRAGRVRRFPVSGER